MSLNDLRKKPVFIYSKKISIQFKFFNNFVVLGRQKVFKYLDSLPGILIPLLYAEKL